MKIAIIGLRSIGPMAAGGVEKVVEELSTRYVRLGHDVTVFCRAQYDHNTGDTYKGVRLERLPAVYTKHLEAISNTVAAVFCALRGYDIIHINATGPALLSFVPRLLGRKVVVTVHGLDWKREKWGAFARMSLKAGAWAAARFPQRTIVVSRTLQRHYEQTYRKQVLYIPNGVTLPDLEARAASNPLGLPANGYVLFLSRLVPEKGCHTLISAFRKLDTDKRLVIVGPPSHSEQYAASLKRLAEGDSRIIFAGPLFGDDKDAVYRDACLFVLPSTIEGMALALLEAMSYRRCCLCSDIDENLEVIDPSFGVRPSALNGDRSRELVSSTSDGPVAASFRTGDVDDLQRKLSHLLSHPAIVDHLGERAMNHVARHFDWDTIARTHLAAYQNLVTQQP